MITKSEKKDVDYKNLTLRITREEDVHHLNWVLMSYLKLRNLVLILIKRNRGEHLAQPDDRPDLFKLLTNPVLMRALLWGQKGGKNEEKVSFLRGFYKTDALMLEAIQLGMTLKDKIITELVKQVQQNFRSFFALKAKGIGHAREPKAIGLRRVSHYSLPVDMETVSFKRKNKIRLLLSRGQSYELHVNHAEILKSIGDFKRIKRMEISLKNGSIYLLFSYLSPPVQDVIQTIPRSEKLAGLDLGVARLASIYIHDQESPSILIDGKEFSSFNAEYNRKNAKIWSELAPIKNQMGAIEKAERQSMAHKENREGFVPLSEIREKREDYRLLNNQAFVLEKRLKKLSCRRRHFFDSNFKKLSKRLMTHLAASGVTHLVTSRNILACKHEGPELGRVQNQRFFNIPFGQLIDALRNAGSKVGIKVTDDLDEAYSSKTSSVSGDVCKVQEVSQDKFGAVVRSDVFPKLLGGRRVKRGLYEDAPSGWWMHADINAAVNLVKLELNKLGLDDSRWWKKVPRWKLSNPRKLIKNALLKPLRPSGIPVRSLPERGTRPCPRGATLRSCGSNLSMDRFGTFIESGHWIIGHRLLVQGRRSKRVAWRLKLSFKFRSD